MSNIFSSSVFSGPGLGYGGNGTRTGYALDTAFTLGSAGKALGIRFIAPTTTSVQDVLFFVSAAPGSAHNLSVNVCAQTSATQPGSALTNGSVSISGGTTAGVWIKATLSPAPSVTEGTAYWIVIGDPSGAAANYSVLSAGGGNLGPLPSLTGTAVNSIARNFTSSDGFATAGTGVAVPLVFCINFTDGKLMGQPYSLAVTADASAAVERGWLITPDEDITISYIVANMVAGSLKVYPSASAPGGTIFSGFNSGNAFTIPASAVANGCVRFPACTLVGGSQYRIVLDPTAAATTPGYTQIEDDTTHTAILEACGAPGISMKHTEESGGAWVDDGSKLPRIFIGFDQLPAQAAGGGLLTHPGMAGGMRG